MMGAAALLSRVPLFAWTALGAVALMAVPLALMRVELGMVRDQAASYKQAIENPDTGYIARLTTCRDNVAGLESSLDRQNAAITAIETESAERIARAEREAEEARAQIEASRSRADRIIARPIAGATVCERVMDVDRAFLEELQQ